MSYYPVFLDIKGRRCVVIGGGSIAWRKVNMLVDHEAKVDVFSSEVCLEIEDMAARRIIQLVRRNYQPGDLKGAFVVVAATNDQEVNEQVATEAKERGVLINVVDVPALSNFIVPSYLHRGDLTIAVSTNGKSPALARKVRSEMEKEFGPEYAELTSMVNQVRSQLKTKGITVSNEVWQKSLEIGELIELIRSGKQEQAQKRLLQSLGESST